MKRMINRFFNIKFKITIQLESSDYLYIIFLAEMFRPVSLF